MASGGIDAQDRVAAPNYLRDVVRVTAVPEEGGLRLETTIKSPRSLWFASMRRLLEDKRGVIQALRWRTAVPFGAEEWPLADHPVLTLEYHSATDYRFVGGFGRAGCEVIMPISPRLAVYAKVGDSKLGRFQFSKEQTQVLQRLFVERSWRFVISRAPIPGIEAEHPREINAERFVEEEEAWRAWHQIQSASEKAFDVESNASASGLNSGARP